MSSLSSRSEEADQKAGLGVGAGAGVRAKTSRDRLVAVPLLSLTVAWNKLKYIRSGQHTAQNGNFRISPNRILHDTLCLLILHDVPTKFAERLRVSSDFPFK